jgi:hypothetical protein
MASFWAVGGGGAWAQDNAQENNTELATDNVKSDRIDVSSSNIRWRAIAGCVECKPGGAENSAAGPGCDRNMSRAQSFSGSGRI